jgi:exodeoxyribonuclease V alpha subunit
MEILPGVISRVLHHDRSKWSQSGMKYVIAALTNGTTVKGEMRTKPPAGEKFNFYGDFRESKGDYGPYFQFVSFEPIVDESVSGATHYLKTYVDKIGLARAAILAEHFGVDCLKTLKLNPEKAIGVPGIPDSVGELVRIHFAEDCALDPVAYAKLVDLFSGHNFSQKVVIKLLEHFGSDAPAMVKENPYILLSYPRMGWKGVDSFALTKIGFDPRGIERQVACLKEALTQIALENGHTYATRFELDGVIWKLISGSVEPYAWMSAVARGVINLNQESAAVELLKTLTSDRRPMEEVGDKILANARSSIIDPDATFSLPALAEAEDSISRSLRFLQATARRLPCELSTDGLSEDQVVATKELQKHGVVILEGPPGVGKTWTVAKALRSMREAGLRVIGVAPTGKASKRLSELFGFECSTIHHALGPRASTEEEGVPSQDAKHGRGRDAIGFSASEADPLDCDVIAIDESSMLDTLIASALLRALAPGTRVIFVGDINQLPSIGAGSVLRDLMNAGVPTVSLTKILRSESAGRIVHACHAIRDGKTPVPAIEFSLPTENWIHIELSDPPEILRTISDLHHEYTAFPNPITDLQVISPIRDGGSPIGCKTLNQVLSYKLNPPKSGEAFDGQARFRVGDKVVRTKNDKCDELVLTYEPELAEWSWRGDDYEINEGSIVNGDMGIVEDIIEGDRKSFVVVRFRAPEKLVRLPLGDCHLELAYALTCHKAQGSGFPLVIIPVHDFYYDDRSQRGIWTREWYYTGKSRGEKGVITVGKFSSIESAIKRKTIGLRRTRLVSLIQGNQTPKIELSSMIAEAMSL